MAKYTIRTDPASGKAISEVNSDKTSIGVKANVNRFDSLRLVELATGAKLTLFNKK